MTAGNEVVEDYGHVGLTLRQHPVSFLRADLDARKIVTCGAAMAARDGRWVTVAVLVRQRPGSAKGVMFITIEDETGVSNLVVWPQVFEDHRRVVMGARMLAVNGRLQREGEVVHLVAHKLADYSDKLASVGRRGEAFPLRHSRGDGAAHGGGPDPRDLAAKLNFLLAYYFNVLNLFDISSYIGLKCVHYWVHDCVAHCSRFAVLTACLGLIDSSAVEQIAKIFCTQ